MLARQFSLFLITSTLLLGACAGETKNTATNSTRPGNSANVNANTAPMKDDVEELENVVKMPFHPEEAVWHEDDFTRAGEARPPATRKLTAVVRFKKDDAAKIVAAAEKLRPTTTETITPESWFPAELIAQSQVSGDETLKGTSFGANDFYLSPYNEGKLIRFDGSDYFLLELFAK